MWRVFLERGFNDKQEQLLLNVTAALFSGTAPLDKLVLEISESCLHVLVQLLKVGLDLLLAILDWILESCGTAEGKAVHFTVGKEGLP